jgi:hypothetical protein
LLINTLALMCLTSSASIQFPFFGIQSLSTIYDMHSNAIEFTYCSLNFSCHQQNCLSFSKNQIFYWTFCLHSCQMLFWLFNAWSSEY